MFQVHAAVMELLEDWYSVGRKVTRFVRIPMHSCSGIIFIHLSMLTSSFPRPYGMERIR